MPSAPRLARQAPPPGFAAHVYDKKFVTPHAREAVWAWLCDPSTFTESQIWPYRVEFVDPETGAAGGFAEGVHTAHHGPLISFAGVLSVVRAPAYRDLRYFYGSYALSLRLIRPVRLQFWLHALPGKRTRVRLRLDSFVRPWLAPVWTSAQGLFWDRFPHWMGRSLAR